MPAMPDRLSSEVETFPNAPIMEALLDVRLKEPTSLESLAIARARLTMYPKHKEMKMFQVGVQFQDTAGDMNVSSSSTAGQAGYMLTSQDGKDVVQVRRDGFSISRLAPYDKWERFRSRAHQAWGVYKGATNADKVSRLGLRYINRIDLPYPFDNFSEYVATVPEVAKGVPQGLEEFFMRLVIPYDEKNCRVIITEALDMAMATWDQETGEPKSLSLMLDIDVFRMCDPGVTGDDIWPAFNELRDVKNDVFFKSTTDKAKEMFR